ncbi:MAG: hypothetical protein AAF761_08850 [Pseudomonadota bacterium]
MGGLAAARFASIATAAILMASGAATALSCLPPNPAKDFNSFADSTDAYSFHAGRIEIAGPVPAFVDGTPRRAAGVLVGPSLTGSGLGPVARQAIVIETRCVAHWCGGIPATGSAGIFALRQEGPDRVLTLHACPTSTYQNDTPELRALLVRCLKAGRCSGTDEAAWSRLR